MADDKPTLTRRRVLGGMATIGAAGAVGAGSWAAFSDQAKDVSATFTAGALDGSVSYTASYNGNQAGEGNYADIVNVNPIGEGVELELTDVKPGDYGSITFDISLTGNDAWVASCLAYEAGENGTGGPEAESEANDEKVGDLQENLLTIPFYSSNSENNFFDGSRDPNLTNYGNGTGAAFWNSREGTNDYEDLQPMTVGDAAEVQSVDTMNWSDGTPAKTEAPEKSSAGPGCILLEGSLANGGDTNTDNQGVSPLPGGSSLNFGYDWHLPFDTGNEAQTDKLTLKFGHQFSQVRHSKGPKMTNVYAPENTDADNDSTTTN